MRDLLADFYGNVPADFFDVMAVALAVAIGITVVSKLRASINRWRYERRLREGNAFADELSGIHYGLDDEPPRIKTYEIANVIGISAIILTIAAAFSSAGIDFNWMVVALMSYWLADSIWRYWKRLSNADSEPVVEGEIKGRTGYRTFANPHEEFIFNACAPGLLLLMTLWDLIISPALI